MEQAEIIDTFGTYHSSVPVDYWTDDPEGEGSMSAVLETSDRHVDSVSVFVDSF